PGLKFLLVVALTIAMAVPLFFINLALADRESTAQGAAQDIATGWGGTQVVAGPILLIPFEVPTDTTVDDKIVHTVKRFTAVLLPETLDFKADTSEETRFRGIFAVPVYRSALG